MNLVRPEMTPEIKAYYLALKARNELTRSDVSIYPSYTDLTLPYRVVCRQRYYKAGVKQRRQFLKEIRLQEALQSRALDGVRVHREFCNPVISSPQQTEIVTLTREESMELEKVKNGHIRRVVDDEVKSLVLELSGTNVATTYITCPIKARASLGIKLPFLVMVVKNMKKYFTFEIQISDDKDMRRRFRVSNFQSTTKVRPFCTTMPIGLSPGWNQIQFNLADFTRRAYGSTYLETVRVQIHANVRIRRIYFSDRLYGDDEMPQEFKLFLPIPGTHRRQDPRKPSKEAEKKSSKDAGTRASAEIDRIELIEEELPSEAPPATPVEPETPSGVEEHVGGEYEETHAVAEEERPLEGGAEEGESPAPAEGEAPHSPEGEAVEGEEGGPPHEAAEGGEGESPPPTEAAEEPAPSTEAESPVETDTEATDAAPTDSSPE